VRYARTNVIDSRTSFVVTFPIVFSLSCNYFCEKNLFNIRNQLELSDRKQGFSSPQRLQFFRHSISYTISTLLHYVIQRAWLNRSTSYHHHTSTKKIFAGYVIWISYVLTEQYISETCAVLHHSLGHTLHFKINVVSVCSRLTNVGFSHSFTIDYRKSVGTQFI
jgi:hypothetical protein